MPWLNPAYRGPVVVMGVGASFALVGAIPVACTLGLGERTSATIIGVGFMGFGVLLIIPALCWCFVLHTSNAWWRYTRTRTHGALAESVENEGPPELETLKVADLPEDSTPVMTR